MACADKAHKVDGDGGAQVCSSTPQAAGTSTLIALRPLPFFYPHIVAKAVTGKPPPSLGLCLDVRGYSIAVGGFTSSRQSFGHVFQVLIKLYSTIKKKAGARVRRKHPLYINLDSFCLSV